MYSGIDVVDIERFSDRIEANAALMQRLFSADELNSCKGALPSLAARFCAKEAALKVLGQADVVAHAACFGSGDGAGCAAEVSGLDDGAGVAGLNFRDIEVTSRPGQAPQLRLHGQVAAWARRLGLHSWRVSLAHDKVAMAQVWASGGPAEGCKVSSHDATLARYLLKPEADSHKYSRGVVRIIAGSQRFPGAGLLCVAGASHSGVGMIRLNAPERVENLVLAAHPQIVPDGPALTGTCDALVLGPGLDAQKADWEAAAQLLENTPAVIDASALEPVCALIKEGKLRLHAHHILTPHDGELARCLNLFAGTNTGEIAGKLADKADKPLGKFASQTSPALQRRIQRAQQLAALTGACVLAKGNRTVVVDAKAQVHTLPAATPWLATAGSGDVLAGLMGGLLALNVRAGAGHVGAPAASGSATSADAAGTSQQSADAQGQDTTAASAAALAPEIAQLAARLHALAGQLAAEATSPKPTDATGPKSAGAVVAHPITAPEIAAAIPNAWALYASAAAN